MNEHFFPCLVFVFLCLYLFFWRSRIRKLKTNLLFTYNQTIIEKSFKVNNYLSLIIIFTGLIAVSCHAFFPNAFKYNFPLIILNTKFIIYLGMFIIKIAFMWMVISGIQASYSLDSLIDPPPLKKVFKIEMVMLIGVVLLCLGIFCFIPALSTFCILVLSIFSLLVLRKNMEKIRNTI